MSGNRYFLSVYGLAVKHGFQGTEEDFLQSLIGPQGPRGLQGLSGFSPQVQTGKIDGGYRISITYADDNRDNELVTISFDIMDGKPPELDDTLTVPGMAADAAAVGAGLSKIPNDVVRYRTPQDLPPIEKAQARKNINAGLDAPDYYHTEREELGVSHENINTAYVYSLYDALMAQYPDYVQKKPLTANNGSVVLYEYVINCKTEGIYAKGYGFDDPARKPKYLILSGIHGTERNAVFSTYRFVRDMVNGHNVPKAFKDGAVLCVVPVADPTGFDDFTYGHKPYQVVDYTDKDGKPQKRVDYLSVDKNFDWEWDTNDKGYSKYVWGESAADMPETQAITKWLHDHSDAVAFINYHNNGYIHENVAIIAPADDKADQVKRAAMRGVDRVIPYWRDVIGYPDVETVLYWDDVEYQYITAVKPVIFSYSAEYVSKASSTGYALNVVGIPSIYIETSTYYGNFSDWWDYDADKNKPYYNEITGTNADNGEGRPSYQPEVIAMGAEALGNILIELFSEASEVKDMTGVSNKLDMLIEQVNSGFRVESGTLKIKDISKYYDSATSRYNLGIPCSKGAKTIAVYPDEATLKAIYNSQTNQCFGSFVGNFFAPDAGIEGLSPEVQSGKYFMRGCSYMTALQPHPSVANYWMLTVTDQYTYANNDPDGDEYGVIIPKLPALSAGTYNWTAYYWNE